MSPEFHYTDEKNCQIVIALLKAHGIRKVIANPGTTNMAFVGSVQNDPWFQVYSGIDERHSAYMAVGMAAECGEPVVLSCTGATASRNYLPALTEAYYRKLPILALTSTQVLSRVGQLWPQTIDRSVQPKDTVRYSVVCNPVQNEADKVVCERNVNAAILELRRHGGGPVHINLVQTYLGTYNTVTLPKVRKVERWFVDDHRTWPEIKADPRVVIWLGSRNYANEEATQFENESVAAFASRYETVVVCDKTSAYSGPNRVDASLLCSQPVRGNPQFALLRPGLIIYSGEVTGDYPSLFFMNGWAEVWRVAEDGELRDTLSYTSNIFEMSLANFCRHYGLSGAADVGCAKAEFAQSWKDAILMVAEKIPDLPFSNPWIAGQLYSRLPHGCELHLGILNTLRSWNYFPVDSSIRTYCNVGGFGIDGCLSTLIGGSIAKTGKLHFGVIGDLSFFYDLNALGNRHIGSNLRILLINNGCGTEFRNFCHPAHIFGEQANDYIAAGGHFKNQSRDLVKHYATDLGFRYLSADDKGSFGRAMDIFLSADSEQSIVLECFTNPKLESDAQYLMMHLEESVAPNGKSLKQMAKAVIPQRVKNAMKELMK